jgi:hypothetical protein
MFRLSSELFGTGMPRATDETRWRASLGRAYYACFLTARDNLFGVDGRPTDQQLRKLPRPSKGRLGSHQEVSGAIGAHSSLRPGARKRQKDWLESLKALRVAADYRTSHTHPEVAKLLAQYGVTDWEGLAKEGLTLASQLLPELRNLPRFT